jgi:hypothetical protein
MNRWKQLALVLGGYVLAVAAGVVAVVLYDRSFSPADSQAMGGMIAGGEMFLGAAVFGLVALVPTGLALWFSRGYPRLWSVFSIIGPTFALAGLAMVITTMATRGAVPTVPLLALAEFLGIVQMFASPLCFVAFLLFAALAPARHLRSRMLAGAAIEVAIAACALVRFLVTAHPL